jgi:hypothetical protein
MLHVGQQAPEHGVLNPCELGGAAWAGARGR